MSEQQLKRNIAYKLRIGDLFLGKQIIENERISCVELGDKKIVRINIIANVIEKYQADSESNFFSSAFNLSSMIFSIPFFPKITGTPR